MFVGRSRLDESWPISCGDEVLRDDRGRRVRERHRRDDVDVLARLVRVLHQRFTDLIGLAALGEHDLILVGDVGGPHLGVVEVAFVRLVPVRHREPVERAGVSVEDHDVARLHRIADVGLEHLAARVGLGVVLGARLAEEDPDFDRDRVTVRVERARERARGVGELVPRADRRGEALILEPAEQVLRVLEVEVVVIVPAEMDVDVELAVGRSAC